MEKPRRVSGAVLEGVDGGIQAFVLGLSLLAEDPPPPDEPPPLGGGGGGGQPLVSPWVKVTST